jgi:hypothetical protein
VATTKNYQQDRVLEAINARYCATGYFTCRPVRVNALLFSIAVKKNPACHGAPGVEVIADAHPGTLVLQRVERPSGGNDVVSGEKRAYEAGQTTRRCNSW